MLPYVKSLYKLVALNPLKTNKNYLFYLLHHTFINHIFYKCTCIKPNILSLFKSKLLKNFSFCITSIYHYTYISMQSFISQPCYRLLYCCSSF